MARSKWNKDNIKVTINIPEDEEQFKELTDRWNKGIAQLIIDKIKKLPEEYRSSTLDMVKAELKNNIEHRGLT